MLAKFSQNLYSLGSEHFSVEISYTSDRSIVNDHSEFSDHLPTEWLNLSFCVPSDNQNAQ